MTDGYKRITGRRRPGQMPDGTFTANKSRTVYADAAELRRLILSDEGRRDLFPGRETELRSQDWAKSIRVDTGPGVAQFALAEKPDGRVTVTVAHQKLPHADDVGEWRFYWDEWLDAIDEPD